METTAASRNAGPLQGAPPPNGAEADEASRAAFSAAMDAAGPPAPGGEPAPPSKPSATDKRPEGDERSAQEIIDGDATLKNLGNQSGVKDNLKKQVGDFENDPDAAYRASQVLKHIKGSKTSDGEDRSEDVKNNGKIEGFTKDGDARHGTEAGLLQDFGKGGYSALKDDGALDKTNDRHVKKDGTNLDNAAFAGNEILKGLSTVVSGVGEAVGATLGKVPGLGKLVSSGIEVATTAVAGGLDVASTAVEGGDTKKAAEKVGYDVAQTAVESAVGLVDPTGVAADAAGEAFRKGVDKNGAGSADGKDGSAPGSRGKGGKGKGASPDAGKPKGGDGPADGGRDRGGVSADDGRTDRNNPKRSADQADLAGAGDRAPKAPRTDIDTNGTYGDKEKEKQRLGIATGSNTHQSEHPIGYAVLHDRRGKSAEARSAENNMPAYHEAKPRHRDHIGTGSSSENYNTPKNVKPGSQQDRDLEAAFNAKKDDRLDRTGWSSAQQYRNDQREALNDPAARREDANLSNAYQLNQLGYGQQIGHQAAQNPGQPRPSPDAKADDSFSNMVHQNPALEHKVGNAPVEDRLSLSGQAEVWLARQQANTGRYPTAQERLDAFDRFNDNFKT